MMARNLEGALKLAARGWPVFPVVLTPKPDGAGFEKKPAIVSWPDKASTNPDTVRSWFRGRADYAVGVVTGPRSGIWVVDEDVPGALDDLNLPATLQVRTPRPGRHLYFTWDPSRPIRNGKLMDGVDIRGEGGFVVVPPSPGWEWMNALKPVSAPDFLYEMLANPVRRAALQVTPARIANTATTAYGRAALDAECAVLASAPPGDRNNQLNRSAYAIGQLVAGGEIARDEGEQRLAEAAAATGLPEAEVEATLSSGLTAGMAAGRSAPEREFGTLMCTDLGNARRLVRRFGRDLIYTPELGWLLWTGSRWKRDESGRVLEFAKATVEGIFDEAKRAGCTEDQDRLAKWAVKSQHASRIEAALRLARTDPAVARNAGEWDADHLLLNVKGGTLDLRSGLLREHRRQDLITKLAPVAWNPDARAPLFYAYLERVLPNNEIRAFVQRWAGYCLTGKTNEQCFVFCHGRGSNGKSVLLGLLRHILGDYARVTPFTTFVARSTNAASNDVAALAGARAVIAAEPDEGVRLSEALIKQLTGEDAVAARFLYKEYFEYEPAFKITLAGNHQPTIAGTDDGIWRRVLLVPFEVQIPKNEQDRDLATKLRKEAPGILAWAYQGLRSVLSEGLCPPAAVCAATNEYRVEEDVLGRFMLDCLVPDESAEVSASGLREAYLSWCQLQGETPVSQKRVGAYLRNRGHRSTKSGTRSWRGLRLQCDESSEAGPLDHLDPPATNPSHVRAYREFAESGVQSSNGPQAHAPGSAEWLATHVDGEILEPGGDSACRDASGDACRACGAADWWRSSAGRRICRRCHPPAPGAEVTS